MVAQVLSPEVHPLYDVAMCLHGASEALAGLPEGALPQSDAHALEVVVEETTRLERKLGEFRLRVSRAAEESRAAVSTGATDTGAWLARLTGSSAAVMRGGLWLSRMLQERYPSVREAFASGGLGEDHARVIVRAAERMPRVVTDEDRQQAVSQLVEATVERRLNVKAVRRKARRMLDRISREYADQHEAALVAEEERVARNETWMALDDNGGGTWSGRFVIPDLQAGMLLTALEHLSSPRRMSRNAAGEDVVDPTIADCTEAHMGLGYLAQHGRVGATIAVHIDHHHLLDDLTGIPLCGWHHRRAHDGNYDMRRLTTGEVRYRRRR